jgi:hypothetical protein
MIRSHCLRQSLARRQKRPCQGLGRAKLFRRRPLQAKRLTAPAKPHLLPVQGKLLPSSPCVRGKQVLLRSGYPPIDPRLDRKRLHWQRLLFGLLRWRRISSLVARWTKACCPGRPCCSTVRLSAPHADLLHGGHESQFLGKKAIKQHLSCKCDVFYILTDM